MSPRVRNPIRILAAAIASLVIAGCAGSATPHQPMPKPHAPRYVPPADRLVTSTLLDFDGPYDATFVDAPAVTLADDPARTGNRVLAVDGSTGLSLASLVRGRDYGGTWDVIGVRLWSDVATTCEVVIDDGPAPRSTRVTLAPRTWTNAWIDVTRIAIPTTATTMPVTGPAAADAIRLRVSSRGSSKRLLLDDVVMAQSRVTVCDSRVPKTGERWTVARSGLHWRAALDGQTFFELPASPFSSDGYRLDESSPTRAVFTNASGSTISLDRTGRLIENGVAKLDPRVLKVSKAIAENASPAKIEIVGDVGRVERSLPGDRDNDGYDERRGCYVVHAINGQVAVLFTKQNATVHWPVLEVLDLPPGTISVWLEGELVPWAVRGENGRVTVELPIELQTPVEVRVRVK